ncbi:MAG: glycosyltransferase family 2 protein [Chitinophagales bacterium]|nr:glycosyltransferase family 2 protein [Chitinophagales bacterium]
MEWSIIIFCYNEEGNITKVIQNTISFLQNSTYNNSEIIIVNDGSTDDTAREINQFEGKFSNLKIINIPKNKGIGNALNTGYHNATRDYICAVPGDGQFDIKELAQVGAFLENEFVTFYRVQNNYDWYRGFLTKMNTLFNRYFLKIDISDVNWIKVYRKHQIKPEFRELNSSLVESEITAKLIKRGYVHIDYPSQYHQRVYGKAKGGSWKTLKKAMYELFKLYLIVLKFPKQS